MIRSDIKERPTNDYDKRVMNLDKFITQPKNRKLIKQFMDDALLGKTVKNRAKKTIGKSRLSSYLSFLKLLDNYFKKSFDKITVDDMEKFIKDLQQDKILNRWNKPYTQESQLDIKKTIKKFFKWLYSDNLAKYEQLTNWIETYVTKKEIPALSKDQVEKVVDYAPNLRLKTFFQTLFDTGARINEYLNLKWSDFTYNEKLQCYKVRIREETSKTYGRTITLPLSTNLIKQWEQENYKRNPNDFFMPLTHRNAHALVSRWTKKVLGKAYGCHVFGRHSSATYYAAKLMPYIFCKRFGWTMGSTMAQRYIDRQGLEMEEATEEVQQDIIKKYEEELKNTKEAFEIQKMEMQEQMVEMQKKQDMFEKALKIIDAYNKKLK